MAPFVVFESVRKRVIANRPARLQRLQDLFDKARQFFLARTPRSPGLGEVCAPLFQKIAKSYKEYVIIEDPILLKDYESSVPRADQIRQRAADLGADLAALLERLRAALVANPDPKAVFALFSPFDEGSFILPGFLFRFEYARLDLDSFGRLV